MSDEPRHDRRSTDSVKITRRTLIIVVVVLTAFYVVQGAVLGYFVNENRQRAREGAEAHRAACARKRTLSTSVAAGIELLQERPQGVSGLSRSLIVRAMQRDAIEFASLATVKCDPPAKPLPPIPVR